MIVSAEIDGMIHGAQSLKEKRAVLRRVQSRIQNEFNVSVSEIDHQNLWQRTKIGVVTISYDYKKAEQTIQKVLHFIDSFPEFERMDTFLERL
ncbi:MULTISPECIES: DUF503 domain-containing protein [Salimicrobium]|uniref:YlxP-like protein n=2 Tax=Salimicrobium TaxID=351195 RepID=A0ABY1KQ50_9BACI|nr:MULTISPECIES: DUF503 domain-containing protein [Salimicrobium]SDX30175.1 hypothetical protein SAMN04488081_0095 [Salimicrobium album]SIS64188.1 hypothetical protein SAMN05421758_103157 [Salimicrobium salexigens]